MIKMEAKLTPIQIFDLLVKHLKEKEMIQHARQRLLKLVDVLKYDLVSPLADDRRPMTLAQHLGALEDRLLSRERTIQLATETLRREALVSTPKWTCPACDPAVPGAPEHVADCPVLAARPEIREFFEVRRTSVGARMEAEQREISQATKIILESADRS